MRGLWLQGIHLLCMFRMCLFLLTGICWVVARGEDGIVHDCVEV